VNLEGVRGTFRDWFGAEYDLAASDLLVSVLAAEKLGDGDPLWALFISGSGNAKTETVQSASGTGALITSTISSDGALLSASPKKEQAKDATGGLLRRVGSHGVIVIKDVTSILSSNANIRSAVLAALREVHDGRWERNVGTDGGRTLTWDGRIAVIGAVTTAWDSHHDVIASLGDRFVVLRMDSTKGRISAGYKAIANCGDEVLMRAQLAEAVAALVATVRPNTGIHPVPGESTQLLRAADVVTLCRTGVDYDYQGRPTYSHQPEMPTRFAKQLLQVLRGAVAVGMDRTEALNLALRCARDSMPPMRLAILEDVAANPHTRTKEVRQRINKPYNSVDRQLQALHMLGALDCEEVENQGQQRSSWYYELAPNLDITAIKAVPEKLVSKVLGIEGACLATHFSGTRETVQ
jgi:hypothetical protein